VLSRFLGVKTHFLAVSVVILAGCIPQPAVRASSPKATAPGPAVISSFSDWESARLAELAAVDPRLPRRMRIEPSAAETGRAALAAILAGDPGLRVLGQRADLFSFDARARGLDAVAALADAPPRGSKDDAEEVVLLARMIAEERGRVDEERLLPRSASELVRGIVETWSDPASMAEHKELDGWLAARLDDILSSVAPAGSLDATEITELEDALDPLERFAEPSGYPDTQGALARLRVALGSTHAKAPAGLGWEALHTRLALHLGIGEPESVLRERIARTEAKLRAEAKAALALAGDAEAKAATNDAGEAILVPRPASAPATGSRVRDFAPSPERRLIGPSLHAIAASGGDTRAELRALLALHDAVAVTSWALSIQLDGVDPEVAPIRFPLLCNVPPERRGRLVRFAAVRPIECIAVAWMAALVDAASPEERRVRALRWVAYGDAPLDLVARDLGWAR
jgi:hypothetical protein